MAKQSLTSPPSSKHFTKKLFWWISLTAMVALLLFAAGARYAMQWMPEVQLYAEQYLSEEVGAKVSIKSLEGRVEGFYPVFVVHGLTVQTHDEGKAPLVIQHAKLTVDWWRSLLSFKLRAKQVWLSGADIHLIMDATGQVRLRGWSAQEHEAVATPEDLLALLELAYGQQSILLENIRVRFELPDVPALETHDLTVALVKKRGKRHFAASFNAVDEPLSFDVRLRLDNPATRWHELQGAAYTRLQGEYLERWLPSQWVQGYVPFRVSGALELWGALQSKGTANVVAALTDGQFSVRHQEQEGEWLLDNASFLLATKRDEQGYTAQLGHLRGHSEKGGDFNVGPVSLKTKHEKEDGEVAWSLRGSNVSVSGLARHGKAWPFTLPAVAHQFFALNPQGYINQFALEGKGYMPTALSARFTEVAAGDEEGPVSVAGVSGWLAGTESKGLLFVEHEAVTLTLPAVFSETLLANVKAPIAWQKNEEGWQLTSGLVKLTNEDVAAGEASFKLLWPQEALPQLQLEGEISAAKVAAAARYIPLKKLPPTVSDWLAHAFIDGHLPIGTFSYDGAIRAVDGAPMERDFIMYFDVLNTELNVARGWPHFQQVGGLVRVAITPQGIEVVGNDLTAQYLGQALSAVALDIQGSRDIPTALSARGHFQGGINSLNQLFNDTPIKRHIPSQMAEWEFSQGTTEGELALKIPLHPQAPKLEVGVQGHFANATMRSPTLNLAVTGLTGDGAFGLVEGFRSDSFTGVLLGEPITGRATSNRDLTHVTFAGATSIAALQRWQQQPWLQYVRGTLPYQFSLTVPRRKNHQVAWRLFSDMQGTELLLPAPFKKPAYLKLPLNVSWRKQSPQRQHLQVRAQKMLQGEFALVEGGLERGNVRLGGASAVLPTSGFVLDGAIETLNVTEWAKVLQAANKQGTVSAWPTLQADLAINNLRLGDVGDVGKAKLGVKETRDAWDIRLRSENITGELWLPKGYQLRGERPLTANVEEIRWPFNNRTHSIGVFDQQKTGKAGITAHQLPIADVRVGRALLQGKNLGSWQAQLRPYQYGTRFSALQGRWQGTKLTGEMTWLQQSGTQEETNIDAVVNSHRLEDTLASVGLKGFLEGEKGGITLQARWLGNPTAFDYRKLYGKASIKAENAYLPDSSKHTSALRMLGVLNVGHTLGRRLRLDFSDVVQKGLVVDKLSGDYRLAGPLLSTTSLRLVSPSAEFSVAGQLNLETGELDSGVEVTLPLSSNLYAGCLAGPAVCAGAFVIERLWGSRLEKITSMEYQVTGPWQNPKVDDVNGIYKRKRSQYER